MMGKVHGLMIMPSERKLFSEKDIKPMFRYSMKYTPDPGRVFMYQIATAPCPHYAQEKRACNIYPKRPVVCQTFPFEVRGGGRLAIHEFCPEVARLVKDGYGPNDINCPELYLEHGMVLVKYWNNWLRTGKIERYDVKDNKWYYILEGVKPEYLA